jgi:hypothetical protein
MEGRRSIRAGETQVRVPIETVLPAAWLLVPTGTAAPGEAVLSVAVEGGRVERQGIAEGLGLGALLVRPEGSRLAVSY